MCNTALVRALQVFGIPRTRTDLEREPALSLRTIAATANCSTGQARTDSFTSVVKVAGVCVHGGRTRPNLDPAAATAKLERAWAQLMILASLTRGRPFECYKYGRSAVTMRFRWHSTASSRPRGSAHCVTLRRQFSRSFASRAFASSFIQAQQACTARFYLFGSHPKHGPPSPPFSQPRILSHVAHQEQFILRG